MHFAQALGRSPGAALVGESAGATYSRPSLFSASWSGVRVDLLSGPPPTGPGQPLTPELPGSRTQPFSAAGRAGLRLDGVGSAGALDLVQLVHLPHGAAVTDARQAAAPAHRAGIGAKARKAKRRCEPAVGPGPAATRVASAAQPLFSRLGCQSGPRCTGPTRTAVGLLQVALSKDPDPPPSESHYVRPGPTARAATLSLRL